jgi:hexokinase
MESARAAVDRYLKKAGMHHRDVSVPGVVKLFLDEMGRGLTSKSSLPMIPTFIETTRPLPRGQKVIALDAGGTNLRVALVGFDPSGRPVVEDMTRHRMPGSDGEIERDAFFDALARTVLPVAGKAGRIGFCFSYAVEMQPDKDGTLIFFSKEIKAKGVIGERIGAGLVSALRRAGAREPERVVLLNDTVATLLAGRNSAPGRRFDDYIGLVCGTGMNMAYVERNTEIGKRAGLDPAGSQIINTECGSFGRAPRGRVDLAYDASMAVPGMYTNEKMISGGYLGGLCLFTARRALAEGLFTAGRGGEAAWPAALTTKDMNDFLQFPSDPSNPLGAVCGGLPEEEARRLYLLVDSLTERAAKLVAIDLSAGLLKTGRGRDPRFPVSITVDGTTFWQVRGFRTRVECAMRSFLQGENERAFEICSAEDAPLIGAAIAALTN